MEWDYRTLKVYIYIYNTSVTAGVQCVPERLQDLHKHGVRGERRHVHVPPEDEADGGTNPLVVGADPVGVLVHARRGRGAQGPEVREHTADQEIQLADSRLRVRQVRGPRTESWRGHGVRHDDLLGARALVRQAALQPGGRGRVGHRRRAVHNVQQRAAVPEQPQGRDTQKTGELCSVVSRRQAYR